MSNDGADSELRGKRLLFVGINYKPEATGNAPYTSAVAEYCVARGARVTMVTAMPYYPYWRVDERYEGCWRKREALAGVEVRRFRNYIPSHQSAIRRALFEGTFFAHALPSVLAAGRPDAVLGVVPSLGGGVLAAAAAKRFRVPFGIYYHDLVAESAIRTGIRGGRRIAGLTRRAEGLMARQADAIAAVSDGFLPYLSELGVPAERVVHIRQWSHIASPSAEHDLLRQRSPFPTDRKIILHAGAMGLKQGLENVVHAARLAQRCLPEALFVFMGHGNQRRLLESLAADLGNVEFIDPQPEERFSDLLAAADILLLNERASMQDACIPSKLTSYFVAGRPVIAACGPDGAAAREVRRSGAGIVVAPEEPSQLVQGLACLLNDNSLAANLSAAGPDYASKHLTQSSALAAFEGFLGDLLLRRAPANAMQERISS